MPELLIAPAAVVYLLLFGVGTGSLVIFGTLLILGTLWEGCLLWR